MLFIFFFFSFFFGNKSSYKNYFKKFVLINCQKFNINNTPNFYKWEGKFRTWQGNFSALKDNDFSQKVVKINKILTFTHLLFWCSITVIECIYFDETFFWEFCFSVLSFLGNSFVRGGTKPYETCKSFVKRIYYIVHETSTCWDNIRSSMSNVLTLILTLFPMSYRTTEYNLMQRKWILLLWDSKSKHWCTHKVFMLVICHITHLRIMIKEL